MGFQQLVGKAAQKLRLARPVQRVAAVESIHSPAADPIHQPRTTVFAAHAPSHIMPPMGTAVRADEATGTRKLIGAYLLEASIITVEALNEALALAQKIGIRTGHALVQLQHVTEAQVATCLAKQHDLPFHDLQVFKPDPAAVQLLPETTARRLAALPIKVDEFGVTIAMVDPLNVQARAEAAALLGKPVRPVITTEAAFQQALDSVYHPEYTYRSTQALMYQAPRESAFQVLTSRQKRVFGGIALFSLGWLLVDTLNFIVFFNALATLFFLVFSIYRMRLVWLAVSEQLDVPVSREELAALDDRSLPIYTILVPIYREASVLPNLMRSISSLDYPLAKLDVKLLLEADDLETIEAARSLNLPPNFEQIIIPNSLPKTKPKACNYGLIKAKGEFVVIYDAEDLPESDQLKKVLVAFDKSDKDVVCVQAKLNYYNRHQNLLTRWFTIEYSLLFDLLLPGLNASGTPIPLGGTSNHFRRLQVDAIGAWDPFNVTEDADLGIRLYKAGYKTVIIDSTTFEEANSDVGNWIRQRSRWMKGYMQTWLVHMRHPIALWRTLGTRAFLGFNLTVGGPFLSALLNPLYWSLSLLWFLGEWSVIEPMFPSFIFYLAGINLYLGNFLFVYLSVTACIRRGFYDLVKYALLSPLYWILISVGAWKGLIQLFTKPFYWEKTIHGLYKGEPNIAKSDQLSDLL